MKGMAGFLCLLMAGAAFGQEHRQPDGPRERRAAREQAVASLGDVARDLVESYGEDAVGALKACSKPVSLKLAEFHNAGGLKRLAKPRDLLKVIGHPNHGDDVANFAMSHQELSDPDNFEAFLSEPLVYSMSLKKLEEGAATTRDYRIATERARAIGESIADLKVKMLAIAGGAAIVLFLVIRRFGRKR